MHINGGAAARDGWGPCARRCAGALLAVLTADAVVREASRPRIFDVRSVPPADSALVFGAGVEPDGSPSAMLGERLDSHANACSSTIANSRRAIHARERTTRSN